MPTHITFSDTRVFPGEPGEITLDHKMTDSVVSSTVVEAVETIKRLLTCYEDLASLDSNSYDISYEQPVKDAKRLVDNEFSQELMNYHYAMRNILGPMKHLTKLSHAMVDKLESGDRDGLDRVLTGVKKHLERVEERLSDIKTAGNALNRSIQDRAKQHPY